MKTGFWRLAGVSVTAAVLGYTALLVWGRMWPRWHLEDAFMVVTGVLGGLLGSLIGSRVFQRLSRSGRGPGRRLLSAALSFVLALGAGAVVGLPLVGPVFYFWMWVVYGLFRADYGGDIMYLLAMMQTAISCALAGLIFGAGAWQSPGQVGQPANAPSA